MMLLTGAEAVADAMHGLDQAFAAPVEELSADMPDVAVDGAVADMDVHVVGVPDDGVAVEDPASSNDPPSSRPVEPKECDPR